LVKDEDVEVDEEDLKVFAKVIREEEEECHPERKLQQRHLLLTPSSSYT